MKKKAGFPAGGKTSEFSYFRSKHFHMSPAKKIFLFSGLILLTAMLSAARAQGPAQAAVSLDSIQLKTVKGPLLSYGKLTRKRPVLLFVFWSLYSYASLNV